jgi:hypothetical protein
MLCQIYINHGKNHHITLNFITSYGGKNVNLV